jgi:hypothetical protein
VTAFLRQLRAHAARCALAVAVCQVALVCSATMVLAASTPSSAVHVTADEECSCDHSTGVMCPMHRRASSRPTPTNAPRWCKGVDGSSYAVLPVLGTLSLPERVLQLAPAITESTVPAPRTVAPRPLAHPPDSPPPRA